MPRPVRGGRRIAAAVMAALLLLVLIAAGCPQQPADEATKEEPKQAEERPAAEDAMEMDENMEMDEEELRSDPHAAAHAGPAPPKKPATQRGKAIFEANCVRCHGEQGNGQGPDAVELPIKPANFTDAQFVRGEKPLELFQTVTDGKGPMPSFKDSLSDQERWDALFYAWSFHLSGDDIAAGKELYEANCATCHGDEGKGDGPAGANLKPKPVDFTNPLIANDHQPNRYFQILSEGAGPMPAFEGLSEDERWQVLAYERTFSYKPSE